jgi:hypothetical protein
MVKDSPVIILAYLIAKIKVLSDLFSHVGKSGSFDFAVVMAVAFAAEADVPFIVTKLRLIRE